MAAAPPDEKTQVLGGRTSHRPRVSEVFTEYLPSGNITFIVVTTKVTKGAVTAFEAGLYPQTGPIHLYKFKLTPRGEWRDVELATARPGGPTPPGRMAEPVASVPIVWHAPPKWSGGK